MRFKSLALLFALVVAAGCASEPPTIDASSAAALEQSIQEIRSTLSDADRQAFDAAIQFADATSALSGRKTDSFQAFDGMTADEVVAKAASIINDVSQRMARLEEQRRAAEEAAERKTLDELEAKVSRNEEMARELAKFEIEPTHFRQQESSMLGSDYVDIVSMNVRNGTEHAISYAVLHAVLQTPGRAVPWVQGELRREIPGGLEPGETDMWTIRAYGGMLEDWGRVKVPDDAELSISVVRLDGPDGKTLFELEPLSEREQQRLAELREKYR